MNDTLLNKNIIEAIRRAYAAPTPESTSAKTEERQGVMARTQSQVSSALEDTAQDALASVEGLIGKTMDARTDKDISMKELGKLVMDATDPQEPAPVSEDPDREFYQSGIPIEDRFPAEADTGEGLMSPVPPVKSLRPKARPEGLTDDDMGLPDDDNYMGVLDDGPTQDLLDRIALGEGADPKKLKAQNKYGIGATEYDMVYGYGSALAPDKPITEMTMKELEAYQRKLIAATKGKVKGTSKGTSAVGKYQVIKTSLFGKNGTAANPQKDSWADKLGLTEDTVYTPAIQEKIGFLALKEAGYNSYINGNRSQDSFQNRIANIWASVAKADGTDKYGQGIHTVKKDLEPMFKSLAPIKTDDTAVETSPRPQARN